MSKISFRFLSFFYPFDTQVSSKQPDTVGMELKLFIKWLIYATKMVLLFQIIVGYSLYLDVVLYY